MAQDGLLSMEQDGVVTRRGLLVRAGSTAAVAAAASVLSAGAPAVALAAPAEQAANTLRLNTGSEPDTIDPQKASFVGEIEKIMMVFRNLMALDKDGNPYPEMAAGMPEVTEDGTRLTFTLRDGLVFSDGTPLTASHFEYAWKRHLDPNVAGEYAFTGYIISGAEEYNTADPKKLTPDQLQALRDAVGVKALDDKTITFKLKAPAPYFLAILGTWNGVPVRQELIMQGNGGNDSDSTWTEPATYIGNGPYVLTLWEHQNRMHFKANPLYYRGAPPISDYDYAMISEPAVAFAAYLNDELDRTGVQVEDKRRVDSDPELSAQFVQYPGTCTFYVGFNTQKAPFDNQKVRSAFSFALDRAGFVRDILGGQGIPARQFVPPGFPGYYEFELEEQTFNPTVAQRLLAEAGYPGGKGLPEIKLTYSANARNKTRFEALAAMYKQNLGIDMPLDPVEPRAYTALVKDPKTTPQLFFLGWCQDYPDPQDWYSTVFHSKSTVTHVGWKNPEFDRLVDAADIEQDPGRRRELYRQAAQILINDAPVAFFYYSVVWALTKPRVKAPKAALMDPNATFFLEHYLYESSLAG